MTVAPVLPSDDLLAQPRIDLEAGSVLRLPSLATWDPSGAAVAAMPIESILVSRNGHIKVGDLDGLTASIQARGVLEPVVVTPDGRLLAGRRRLEAARRAGLSEVPVRVCEIADERAAIEIGLVENVQRADLDPLTRGKSYRALLDHGATVEEIARLVGQGTGHVYQHLALLDLNPEVQEALHTRKISFADARSLSPLELEDQAAVLREIQESPKPLSSRQVKTRVDARRVLRLVQHADPASEGDGPAPQGSYASLFEKGDQTKSRAAQHTDTGPLDQLNAIIAEMVAAAQGEDQLRAWARKLSRILEQLQQMRLQNANGEKNAASALQNRLL